MPKCKNDSTRSYKGNEPSPKGLGICAHKMRIRDARKGNDGNMWKVIAASNGTKRWVRDHKVYDVSKNTHAYVSRNNSVLISKKLVCAINDKCILSVALYSKHIPQLSESFSIDRIAFRFI